MIDYGCDKVYKNVLLVIRCKFVYLNFIDAYRRDYGIYAQK